MGKDERIATLERIVDELREKVRTLGIRILELEKACEEYDDDDEEDPETLEDEDEDADEEEGDDTETLDDEDAEMERRRKMKKEHNDEGEQPSTDRAGDAGRSV